MFNLSASEDALFKKLSSPAKIQDYLNSLSCNFEKKGDTNLSPRRVIREKHAHCIEGAVFAAAVLWYHGHEPLVLDLKAARGDYDHVIAPFKKDGFWGAISKTNHAVLRYREPIYKTIRELVLSYFHEYFTDNGRKTLRSYTKPLNLKKFGTPWITDEDDIWEIGAALYDMEHIPLVPASVLKDLRRADAIEIQAGKLVQYK